MKVKWKYIFFLLLIFPLSACQKFSLSNQSSSFETATHLYTFQLPEGWESVEEYQTEFNRAAVFGALDTQSTGRMFVRNYDEAGLSKETLKKWSKQQLSEEMKEVEPTFVETGDFPCVSYRFQGKFKRREMWIHLYYVATKEAVIEFYYYTPKDQSEEKRETLLQQSIASLDEEKRAEATEESVEVVTGRVENEQLRLQLLGGESTELSDGSQWLIVRYICENKGEAAIYPKQEWEKLVVVSQEGEGLTQLSEIQQEELAEDTQFLIEEGQKEIITGKISESVSIYKLKSESLPIKVTFDSEVFPEAEPVQLHLKN